MKERLIITNGDSAAERMREARIGGEILPWRDVLHEGPVPSALSLEDLSAVRAQFLAQRGWTAETDLRDAFQQRDQLIRQHQLFDSVVLWFEHDLYDQLQMLQILDFFASEPRRTGLYLIQAGKYLGKETPRALKTHLHLIEPVQEAHLALGKLAWNSFRSQSPQPWAMLLGLSTHILPFLRLSMLRLLDELPNSRSGLSRTEFTILRLISSGIRKPRDIFQAFSAFEQILFMGDWSFFHSLDQMGAGGSPLIAGFGGLSFAPTMPEEARHRYFSCELSLTHLGYSVVSNGADALRYRKISRSIGGFYLHSGAVWRWDNVSRQLLSPPTA